MSRLHYNITYCIALPSKYTHFQWSSLSILSSRFPLWRLLCWIDWHQKLQLCRAAPYIGDKNVKTHRTVIEIPSQNKAVHTSDLKKPSTPLIEIQSQSAFVALQGQRRRWECRLSGERQEGKKGLWFPGRLAQLRKLLVAFCCIWSHLAAFNCF